FVSENEIADSANPAFVIALEDGVWRCKLELISRAESPLVNEFAFNAAVAIRIDCRGENPLIFGKCFLGCDGARQIHFAQRPLGFGAKRSQILDHFIDLLQRQSLGERRHDGNPSSPWAALMNRGAPIKGLLARAAVAIGEIRKLS